MKKILIKILIAYISICLFIIFIPTKNLYFFAEEKLQDKKIFINETSINTTLTHTSINGATLYFEDIKALVFEQISLKLWFLYNSININNVKIDEGLKDFLPLNIKNISIIYTPFYPIKVLLSGNGDFGVFNGNIDLIKKVLIIELDASKVMKTSFKKLLDFMKKSKNKDHKDRYVYEYRF